MFFSFEGIDGSGKSTQARLLADALRARGFEVVDVREPGGTVLGEQIRELLLDPESQISPRAELLLFSAARAQLVEAVVRPALNRGAVVIADRLYDSSTAYQGSGRGLAEAGWMKTLHRFATAGRSPSRTYLVDVSPEEAARRRSERPHDRIEQSDRDFYSRVRAGYRGLSRSEADRIVVLDGTLSKEAIGARVLDDALALIRAM
jgi:dTMP kinase